MIEEYVFCRCCRYMDATEELTDVGDFYICSDCYGCYYNNDGCLDTEGCHINRLPVDITNYKQLSRRR